MSRGRRTSVVAVAVSVAVPGAIASSGQPRRSDSGRASSLRAQRAKAVVGCGYLGDRVARFWRDAEDEVYPTTRGGRVEALSRAGLRPVTLDVTHGATGGVGCDARVNGPVDLSELDRGLRAGHR